MGSNQFRLFASEAVRQVAVAVVAVLLGLLQSSAGRAADGAPLLVPSLAQHLPASPLLVLNGNRAPEIFRVEVARSESEQEIGLMYRQALEPRAGMLFPFRFARPAVFWMKNTYIPLDMVFVARSGRVESVLENVEPLTLTPRSSRGPVLAVLELAAGSARQYGIGRGVLVCHAGLRPNAACRKALVDAGATAP